MRRVNNIQSFDPTDHMVGEGRLRLSASYLLGRRVPALIAVRWEADT